MEVKQCVHNGSLLYLLTAQSAEQGSFTSGAAVRPASQGSVAALTLLILSSEVQRSLQSKACNSTSAPCNKL